MNIQSFIERSEKYDTGKSDYLVNANEIAYSTDMNIVIPVDAPIKANMELEIEPFALSQICQKLGPPVPSYIAKCPGWLAAINLAYWQKRVDGRWFIRTHKDHARAVLSEHYVPIANTMVLLLVQDILDIPYRMDGYLGRDTLHLKLVVADTRDTNYGIGCYIGNGEIGTRQLRVAPFIKRTVCDNSIIFQRHGFAHKHYRVSTAYLREAVREYVGRAIGIAGDILENVVKVEMDDIPNASSVVTSICKRRGYSNVVRDAIFAGAGGDRSLFGLSMGLSYAAHAIQMPYDDRIDMEILAGEVYYGVR